MNEGLYLEAMNQLKEMNDIREKENKRHKTELIALKKELISAYGIVRVLDNIYENSFASDEPAIEVKIIIETLREYLSQFVEENILNIT
tara:strand:+ start:1249 stop:1515 length:267 start_codon:yes stop_codon:yes gene_type:complete